MAETGPGLNGVMLKQHQSIQTTVQRTAERQQMSQTQAGRDKSIATAHYLAMLFATSTVLCVGVIIWLALDPGRVVPYVIRVDQFGLEEPIQRFPSHPMKPTQYLARGIIQNWIEQAHGISSDVVVFTQNWQHVHDFSTGAMVTKLRGFREAQKLRFGMKRRVQVKTGDILPVGQRSNAWTVVWQEEVFDQSGQELREESGRFTGIVLLADFQSTVAQQELDLRRKQRNFRNVYGIFVADFDPTKRPLPEEKK